MKQYNTKDNIVHNLFHNNAYMLNYAENLKSTIAIVILLFIKIIQNENMRLQNQNWMRHDFLNKPHDHIAVLTGF